MIVIVYCPDSNYDNIPSRFIVAVVITDLVVAVCLQHVYCHSKSRDVSLLLLIFLCVCAFQLTWFLLSWLTIGIVISVTGVGGGGGGGGGGSIAVAVVVAAEAATLLQAQTPPNIA